ncbi:MAG: acyl-ACP--UDP-N-acetylglucosamine O-acyltransferase [Proteobacteria bacterium]|nr:acyl-ACP--UDP-N-acetylglucosamine O-acyltransferase [Pseudomonadota bacterium]
MIHQTAIVDPKAKVHSGVRIGAYSIIGSEVEIGEDTEIGHHVNIEGPTRIGPECRIFPFASLGLEPQDKKFHGEKSYLEIGRNNTIREYVTINRGSEAGGGITRIGDRGWIMAYCHIAHDCLIGNDVIMTNATSLGGHVIVKDYAILSGSTGVTQFCRIGEYAFTGAQSLITLDVAPFSKVAGNTASLLGVNTIGLERNGFLPEEIETVNQAFKIFFRSGLTKDIAIQHLKEEFPTSEHIRMFVDFIKTSGRNVVR